MISWIWKLLQPSLLALWKPLLAVAGGLLVLARLDWLKRKVAAQKAEIGGLRTKERIIEAQAEIDKKGEAEREKNRAASTADDFNDNWHNSGMRDK